MTRQRTDKLQRRTAHLKIRLTPDELNAYNIASLIDKRDTADWARLILNTAAQLAIDESVDADARTVANARIEP